VAIGISRIRRGEDASGETTVRVGALGAVLAHLADGQVGIATSMSLTLFWFAAALVTSPPWSRPALSYGSAPPRLPRSQSRPVQLVVALSLAAVVTWLGTRWLFASIAFAEGARHVVAERAAAAHQSFRRSADLLPWIPLPADATASSALWLAGIEADTSRRLQLLHETEAILARSRRYALGTAGSWTLTGRVAFAAARSGEPSQFAVSRDAFAAALRMDPRNATLLAQLSWVWLESGDVAKARRVAEEALNYGPGEWLAWAVLAHSARAMGDQKVARDATQMAWETAPSEAESVVKSLLP